MPRPRGSRNKPKDSQTEVVSKTSGTIYIYSDMSEWADTEVTGKTIERFKRNAYATARFTQLINIIFQGDLILEIDGENGTPDEEVATKIRKMIESPLVDLNYQGRQCFMSHWWHGPYIYNCVYAQERDSDGWWVLKEVRDLPPKSFDCEPEVDGLTSKIKSELYPGISLMSDNKVHYCQLSDEYGTVQELKYVKHVRPPNDFTTDISGMPLFYPVISILNRLNFAWKCQMQRVNRVGAPSIFIEITDPIVITDVAGNAIPGKRNDYEYANTILKNWGTNNSFALPSNMKIVELKGHESDSAMDTIHELAQLLVNQWSPTEQISSDGNAKLGGSQEAATTLLINFIVGFHRHIAKVMKSIVEDILRYNNFTNYTVKLYFPKPEFRNSEIDLERAKEGRAAGNISPNEHRMLCGHEPESDEDIQKYRKYWIDLKQAEKFMPGAQGTAEPQGSKPPAVKVPEKPTKETPEGAEA